MRLAIVALLVIASITAAGAAPAADCASEAAALQKDEADLPKLEFARPADRPPYCITLETNVTFALRVKAHVARCPQSDYAGTLAAWEKRRADYGKLFSQYRCKRTM